MTAVFLDACTRQYKFLVFCFSLGFCAHRAWSYNLLQVIDLFFS
jgi:hypothetical protein